MTAALVLLALFALLLVGVPVAFALGGLGYLMLEFGGFSPLMVPQGLLSTIDNFILLAVPLFLLMSNVLLKAASAATSSPRSKPGSATGRAGSPSPP